MEFEDSSLLKLWLDARHLTSTDVVQLEHRILVEPTDLESRFSLLSFYSERYRNTFKHEGAAAKLAELLAWFIANCPGVSSGHLSSRMHLVGYWVEPKAFALLREAWLEQVARAPNDPFVLGNAADFIAKRDIETASSLYESAYKLQPEHCWLGHYVMHLSSELSSAPYLYQQKLREQILDLAVKSLKTEKEGSPSSTFTYLAEVALDLKRHDMLRWGAKKLCELNPDCEPNTKPYLGLAAVRDKNIKLADKMMLQIDYMAPEVTWFAQELFDAGGRESIIRMLKNIWKLTNKSTRERWIRQIAADEKPDFDWEDCCNCKTHAHP